MGRLGSRKSTTGCATCKIRKVKCDETRPSCRRCEATGRKCEGYVVDRIESWHLAIRQSSASPLTPIGFYGKRDPAETRAFEFFVSQVIPGMTVLIDTEFWHKFVLQASQTDDAVWNATNSMAGLIRQLHTSSRTGDDVDDHIDDGRPALCVVPGRHIVLQWYIRSVDELKARMDRGTTWLPAYSITAVLYMCIECLLGNAKGAMSIYRQAIHAMRSSVDSKDTGSVARNDPVRSSVMALFSHMNVAHGYRNLANPGLQQSLATSPTSLANVGDRLYTLIGETFQFVRGIESVKRYYAKNWCPPNDLIFKRDTLLHSLRQWPLVALTLLDDISGSEHALALHCMHLVHSLFVIWTSRILSMFETAFDEQESTFQEMLYHAEAAINLQGTKQPLFSFESRVIGPLTFVATRCRHPIM